MTSMRGCHDDRNLTPFSQREGVITDSRAFRRLAEPCAHLENLARPGLLRPLVHRGGLRADITKDGVIRLGDDIEAIH